MDVVELSRLQFAITAMYHFVFVPLTLGMSWILVIMESIYVITNKEIYRDMTKFWGKLFGINFAMGVTTGITMEFQFGTNWAYYSHYVGDIFGVPLAIEGLMAFFLESTFIGLFFFAWDKVSKKQHLLITILVAVGSSLSALWILVANGWMNVPVGTTFNPITMRMELDSFLSVLLNPYSQNKFLHTVCAGYVAGSIFIMGISSWYILKKRDLPFARRSFKISASFGFFASLALIILGDNSGLEVFKHQPSKLVAIEGIWETQKAPVGWSVIAWPNQEKQLNEFDMQIPAIGSIILTHDIETPIKGAKDIIKENKAKITNGQKALQLLDYVRNNPNNELAKNQLSKLSHNIGYGLLLKKYTNNINQVTAEMIEKAAQDTIPKMLPMFYAFRLMVAFGISFFILFAIALVSSFGKSHKYEQRSWLLKWSLFAIPLPFIAAWAGWFVAEFGRQPWTIFGILPTHLSISTLNVGNLWFSLIGFIILYTGLAIIEIWLMFKYARLGPSTLKTGRYHFEQEK